MPFSRREILATTLTGAAGALIPAAAVAAPRIRAIAFDAFPVFDPRPVGALAEELFPGHGAALLDVWRTRQFEYTWLRTIAGRYDDFARVTEDALVFAANRLGLALEPLARARLVGAYGGLGPWPDAAPALHRLRAAGFALALLSNFTPAMLEGCIATSGLDGVFDHVLSTDLAATYKPDPRAYRLGPDAFGLPREEILFVAFAGWDAAGAKAFGYPTFWVNRLGLPHEELGAHPDAAGRDLDDLLRHLGV